RAGPFRIERAQAPGQKRAPSHVEVAAIVERVVRERSRIPGELLSAKHVQIEPFAMIGAEVLEPCGIAGQAERGDGERVAQRDEVDEAGLLVQERKRDASREVAGLSF